MPGETQPADGRADPAGVRHPRRQPVPRDEADHRRGADRRGHRRRRPAQLRQRGRGRGGRHVHRDRSAWACPTSSSGATTTPAARRTERCCSGWPGSATSSCCEPGGQTTRRRSVNGVTDRRLQRPPLVRRRQHQQRGQAEARGRGVQPRVRRPPVPDVVVSHEPGAVEKSTPRASSSTATCTPTSSRATGSGSAPSPAAARSATSCRTPRRTARRRGRARRSALRVRHRGVRPELHADVAHPLHLPQPHPGPPGLRRRAGHQRLDHRREARGRPDLQSAIRAGTQHRHRADHYPERTHGHELGRRPMTMTHLAPPGHTSSLCSVPGEPRPADDPGRQAASTKCCASAHPEWPRRPHGIPAGLVRRARHPS